MKIHTKQKEVTVFLFLKGVSIVNIHRNLVNVYQKAALDISTVDGLVVNSNPRNENLTLLLL